MKAIEIIDLWYRYPRSKAPILRGVNLSIRKGEFVTLMGPTASGKSTLCLTLNGLIPHSLGGDMRGEVKVAGMDTRKHTVPELATKVGMVFQDPDAQLFAMTVDDELAFGPENIGLPSAAINRRIAWALKVVRMSNMRRKFPPSLSGGQKQRVAIASALTMLPEILVLDEPNTQLDPVGKFEVTSVVRKLNRKYGMTILMVEHDSEGAAIFSDRVVILDQGRIVADGGPRDVFANVNRLQRYGVRPPQLAELSHMLTEAGLTNNGFLTLEEAHREISRLCK